MIDTKNLPKKAIALSALVIATQVAPAAVFAFRIDNAGTNVGAPTDDGQSFQQQWGNPVNWTLLSGVDDGANGYPDGSDSFIMDRTGSNGNPTRLTTEGAPASLNFVSSIVGTGGGGAEDIVFKLRDFTIGDLESLASGSPFHIRAERDRDITINGVISGAGGLRLSRSGGFSDGVTPDEVITIGGFAPNTITGEIELFNTSASQPSFWVADKVGAFGLSSTVTLAATNGSATGAASLLLTANTIGGEGAFDDDVTILQIGRNGTLETEAGVNEVIGEGNLLIDLSGSGTFTTVAPGTYDSSAPWLSGPGTVTVGAVIPEPSSLLLSALGLLGLVRRKR